jgi:hypothetical protein
MVRKIQVRKGLQSQTGGGHCKTRVQQSSAADYHPRGKQQGFAAQLLVCQTPGGAAQAKAGASRVGRQQVPTLMIGPIAIGPGAVLRLKEK